MIVGVEGWEQMAAYWDAKQGDEGDLWHRALIDPTLLRLLGPVSGQRVLDLACGNGYLARRFARLGAQVIAVDASIAIIGRAREREARDPLGIAYHVADAARLDMLEEGFFDVVVSNMALMDIADAEEAIREVSRVLKPQGRFVFSISHPCFDVPNASAWVVERIPLSTTRWRKVTRYLEMFEGTLRWRMGPDQYGYTRAYHRPLSWYIQTLCSAAFVLTALEEPETNEDFAQGELGDEWLDAPFLAQVPLHCVLEARKLEGAQR